MGEETLETREELNGARGGREYLGRQERIPEQARRGAESIGGLVVTLSQRHCVGRLEQVSGGARQRSAVFFSVRFCVDGNVGLELGIWLLVASMEIWVWN
nr:hypothetical protein Itr_chr05CG20960 [Ipomoea trifida]